MERAVFSADEVAQMLGVSRGESYKIVKRLNDELVKKGHFIVRGKVPKKYFYERFYCELSVEV